MNFKSEQRLMSRSSSGAKIAALLENGKNHVAVEHRPMAFARASPPARRAAAACRHGETDCPCRETQLPLAAIPTPPEPSTLPATSQAARVGFHSPERKGISTLSRSSPYWEVISGCIKEEKRSLPSLAWRCCCGSMEPSTALRVPPLHEGKARFGRMAGGKKKGYTSGSWLRILVHC